MRHVSTTDSDLTSDEVLVAVTSGELVLFANAINETLEAVDAEEFHARVGATRDDALALHAEVAKVIRGES